MASELTIGQQMVAAIGAVDGAHAFALRSLEICDREAPEVEHGLSADIASSIKATGSMRAAVERLMARAVDRRLELRPHDREAAASLLRGSA